MSLDPEALRQATQDCRRHEQTMHAMARRYARLAQDPRMRFDDRSYFEQVASKCREAERKVGSLGAAYGDLYSMVSKRLRQRETRVRRPT